MVTASLERFAAALRATGHTVTLVPPAAAGITRETVWCEAHGGLSSPHFDGPDCVHPCYTDTATRDRLNAHSPVLIAWLTDPRRTV